jgi:uncharacterized protein
LHSAIGQRQEAFPAYGLDEPGKRHPARVADLRLWSTSSCVPTVEVEVSSMIDTAQAKAFLSAGRIAVVGASDEPKNFGRKIVQALTDHGIDTVAVHPRALSVSGSPCYPDLSSVPGPVDGVIVMVPSSGAVAIVRECSERGIARVWLFKGVGPGAVSDDAIRFCNDHGISVVAGACPLMFLEPVGGVHKLHRALRRANGSLAKASA